MTKTAGNVLRMSGLVMEMLGVWGVYNSAGGKTGIRLPLPGGNDVSLAWVAVALGFILWLTGTITVYAVPSRRKSRGPDQERFGPSNPP